MDVDAELERLYGVSLEDFTSERNDLARKLKADGQADDAARVKKLKKPSVSAWAVNRLARAEAESVATLLDLVDRLKDARGADEIHALGAERRELVARLARRAGELAEEAGHAASPGTLQRVTQTLQAGAEESERDLLRRGVLSEDLSPTGFEAVNPFGPLAEAPPKGPTPEDAEIEELQRVAAEADEEAARLTEDAARAEAAAAAASEAASGARRRAREAREKAQKAARAAG